jgi:hypothetical protein
MRALLTCLLLPIAALSARSFAHAEDLIFMLDNRSSYTIVEFYASPTDVNVWEEDILGASILEAGDAARVTIADGREQCDYDLRIVFEDGDVLEDSTDLCETGSYTVTD